MTCHGKVIAGGTIVIPADLRREFGIKHGDRLIPDEDEADRLSVMTFEQPVRGSQRRARTIFGADDGVDPLLREHRADRAEDRGESSTPRRSRR